MFAADRGSGTFNQAVGEVSFAGFKDSQGAQHLVSAVDDDLSGSQQNIQDLLDLIGSEIVARGKHPI